MGHLIGDPVVQVGEDYYGLHLLRISELKRYVEMINKNPELRKEFQGFSDTFLVTEFSTLTFKNGDTKDIIQLHETSLVPKEKDSTELKHSDVVQVGYINEDGSLQGLSTVQRYIAWLPCLVPLSKDYRILQHEFERDNPDGTIISGLYFMLNGRPHGLYPPAQEATYMNFFCEDDLKLIDDSEADKYEAASRVKPIDWIVFEGMLVAKRALAQIPRDMLADKGHLPYLWNDDNDTSVF